LAAAALVSVTGAHPTPASAAAYNPNDCTVVTNCLVIQPVTADVTTISGSLPYGYQVLSAPLTKDSALGTDAMTPIFTPTSLGTYNPAANQQWSFGFTTNSTWNPAQATISPPPGSFQIPSVGNAGYCLAQSGSSTYSEACNSSLHDYWYLEPDPNNISSTRFVQWNFRPRDAYMIRNASDGRCLNQYGGTSGLSAHGGRSQAAGWDCTNGALANDFFIGKVEPGGYDSFNDMNLVNALWDEAGVEAVGQCGVNKDCYYTPTSESSTLSAQCVGSYAQNTTGKSQTISGRYQYSTDSSTLLQTSLTYGTVGPIQLGTSTASAALTSQLAAGFKYTSSANFGTMTWQSSAWSDTVSATVPANDYYWILTRPTAETIQGKYTFRVGSWYSWSWTPFATITATTLGPTPMIFASTKQPASPCIATNISMTPATTTPPAPPVGPAVTTVSVAPGVEPQVESFDPTSGNIVFDDVESNQLMAYSPTSNSVVKTINLKISQPWSLGRNPNTGEFYMPSGADGSVAIVNLATGAETDVAACTGGAAADVGYYAPTNLVFFTCWDQGVIGAFDATTHVVQAWRVPVGVNPAGIGIDATTATEYVTDYGSSQVTVISLPSSANTTPTVKATIQDVGPGTWGMTWTSTQLLVPLALSNRVAVIDRSTNTVTKYLTVGVGPRNVIQVPALNEAFVGNFNSDTVSVIDLNTLNVVGTIPVGIGPHGMLYVSDLNRVFVTNRSDNTISSFAPAKFS